MNCNVPTDSCFSLEGFSARGGKTDEHRDGWGIAFFEGSGCRIFLDVKPSIASPIAEVVRRYPIYSTPVIAHIRKATQGEIALENCHPFQRELWGRYWVVAHNGNLPDFDPKQTGFYQAIGRTDSKEQGFLLTLNPDAEPIPEPDSPIVLWSGAGILGVTITLRRHKSRRKIGNG